MIYYRSCPSFETILFSPTLIIMATIDSRNEDITSEDEPVDQKVTPYPTGKVMNNC